MVLALKNLHSVPVNAFAVTLVLGSTWPVSRESGMLDSASHVIRTQSVNVIRLLLGKALIRRSTRGGATIGARVEKLHTSALSRALLAAYE